MFEYLARLFSRRRPEPVFFDHPALGRLEFSPEEALWESADDAGVFHGGIPGDAGGPDPARADELVQRLEDIERYWGLCADDLLYIASNYDALPKANDPRELFEVAAVSLGPDYWEVCFQTRESLGKWLYVGMQFEGERLVSNSIDT
jgi:hypothetical protein